MKLLKISSSVLLLLVVFMATGCGKPKPKPVVINYPSWYLNPPQNDGAFLYGASEGIDKKSAVDAALNAIASKLSVSVESTMESKKRVSQSSYSKTVTSNIKSSVKKITFNSYEVSKVDTMGFGKTLVLVQVDRKKFYDRKNQELTSKLRVIESSYSSFASKDPISKLKALDEFNKNIQESRELLFLINTVNSAHSIDKDLKRLEELSQEEEKTKSSVRFYFRSNKDAALLVEPLKVALNDEKLKVIGSSTGSSNDVKVEVTSRTNSSKLMGRYVSKASVNIKLINNKGNVVASNKFVVTGRSAYGYSQAAESASRSLGKMIEKEGIYKILGLKN